MKITLRRKIGMVFQKTILFDMSVFNNIAYPLKIRSETNIKKKVEEVIKLLQLNGLENRNALLLSGGESQRVAIAQALVIEPELLLLDEPTANLDPKNTSIIEEVLSYMNKEEKTTIIMTTHNIFQVENLADRIAFLNEGEIEMIGTFQEIFKKSSKINNFTKMENIFYGFSRITDEGISIVDIGDGLQIETIFQKTGKVILHIPPDDIILSNYPIISSMRNIFEGIISQISDMGNIVKLEVNVKNNKSFIVQITKKSFNEMNLNIGKKVYIGFKASSVKII